MSTWIVPTLLSLKGAELREAAHLRWQIENNVFKRLSHLCATKRFWFKHPIPFFNLLRLVAAAVASWDAFLTIVRQSSDLFKRMLRGARFTWNIFFSPWRYTLRLTTLQRLVALS